VPAAAVTQTGQVKINSAEERVREEVLRRTNAGLIKVQFG